MAKKILLILHYPPPVHGASMVGNYIKQSDKINSFFNTKYINLGTTKSIKNTKKITGNKLIHFFRLIVTCTTTNFVFKPDLIYLTLSSNGIGFYKDAILVFLLKLRRVKLIYHLHNKGVKERQHRTVDNWLYKWVFKRGEVILLSKKLYPDIESYVAENRVNYCPNGIPETNFESDPKEKNQPTEILFLSNLIKSKGVIELLEACKTLEDNGVDFRCTLVGSEGDISNHEVNETIKSYGLLKKVEYVGKKYGKEKHQFFNKADIFVFPTYYPNECFPLVLLEALQYSLPVVTTNEGAIEEIIDHNQNGFIVEKKNVLDLAERLEFLTQNPEVRASFGQNGLLKYRKCYTIEVFEDKLLSILRAQFN
ncbi:MAG: glycosyltransferase family 4 protein [Bacteroidota bacterium]